ncbi:hypothetical protein [Streptomyces sp. TRM64462]|uniref:hypothetical protein n=1 Tax=Streptomyces sp. TRM64462 TaxID=2741726 RepID=UPI0015868845|nr:hypothetical protein [Streptomyces sp. TRM64462]
MKHSRTGVTVVALLVFSALSAVMIGVGQPIAAITALIPSVALGVQHIVHTTTGPTGPAGRRPAPRAPHAADGEEE